MGNPDWTAVVLIFAVAVFATSIVIGITQYDMQDNRLKHETCYTQYGYDVKTEETYITVAYCGEGAD